ncbi:MAG: retropepsin-like aspartic protease [Patescibacteria group bacterium]
MKKKISFPYETKKSTIFKQVKRPIATVDFWSDRFKKWISYNMIVDTGADYTILPFSDATDLGVNLEKECLSFETRGIGGTETIYLLERKIRIKIGDFIKKIPVGFLLRDDIPELLGRQECLNNFDVLFSKFTTSFSE